MRQTLPVSSPRGSFVGALAVVALAACASGTGAVERAATATTTATTAPTGSTAGTGATVTQSTPSTAPRSSNPVTIAFGGDVHFEGVLEGKLAARPEHVLDPIAPVLRRADLAMVNLETAITERGTPEPKKYNFRASPRAFDALRAAGVDVVTMANNHGVDYGPVGLADSLAAVERAAFPVVGIGADEAEAYAPWHTVVRGTRVEVLGATDVLDGNLVARWTARADHGGLASAKRLDRLVAAVRAARADADVVVVYLHWGVEMQSCPSTRQQSLARALVDAGADVVVGSHAHVVLGGGRLGNAYVDYGLGNFVFYARSGATTRSGVLTLTLAGRRVTDATFTPARIVGGVATPLVGAEADAARTAWESLRGCTGLTG